MYSMNSLLYTEILDSPLNYTTRLNLLYNESTIYYRNYIQYFSMDPDLNKRSNIKTLNWIVVVSRETDKTGKYIIILMKGSTSFYLCETKQKQKLILFFMKKNILKPLIDKYNIYSVIL